MTKASEQIQPRPVPLDMIWMDDATQSRTCNDIEVIEQYAESIRNGEEFPPVDLFRDEQGGHYIGDGIHRCHAHWRAGREEVLAYVRPGDERAAMIFACGANRQHGLHRSNADKRHAAEVMLELEPSWSNRKIADHCGLGDHLVADVRRELESGNVIPTTKARLGTDGKTRETPTPKKQAENSQLRESRSCEGPADPDFDPVSTEATKPAGPDIDAEAAVYRRAVNDLNRIKRELEDLSVAPKHGVHLASKIVRISKQLDDTKADIRGAEPVEVCEPCAGRGCKKCGQAGFLTRAIVERRAK